MTTMKLIAILALAGATALGAVGAAQARHGGDDAAGDDRGGKHQGHRDDGAGHTFLEQDGILVLARHGADDKTGDDRGGKGGGKDDGAGHA